MTPHQTLTKVIEDYATTVNRRLELIEKEVQQLSRNMQICMTRLNMLNEPKNTYPPKEEIYRIHELEILEALPPDFTVQDLLHLDIRMTPAWLSPLEIRKRPGDGCICSYSWYLNGNWIGCLGHTSLAELRIHLGTAI